MDWSEPAVAVMAQGTAAVIRALSGTDTAFSIRELARLAHVSPTQTRLVVSRLAEHGIVIVAESPAAHLVRLNRDHVAAEPSIAIATLRSRVLDRLREEVAGWAKPAIHVSLFGSAARGDGSPISDIDLLVVHAPFPSLDEQEEWDEQLARSSERIQRWTGNWVGWFQASEAELRRMATLQEPIVSEWRRDAIALAGPALATLLRKAQHDRS